VPPGFEGVFLPRSRFVGGHPSYGRLAVRQDGHQSERVVPGCYLQGPREGRRADSSVEAVKIHVYICSVMVECNIMKKNKKNSVA